MPYRLGIDVGGTFTDLLLINESDGTTFSAKIPTTPGDPSIAVLDGIEQICQRARIEAIEVSHVLHGTTVATKVRAFVRPGHSSLWLNHERKTPFRPCSLLPYQLH